MKDRDTQVRIAGLRALALGGQLATTADVLFLCGVIDGLCDAIRILGKAPVHADQERHHDRGG